VHVFGTNDSTYPYISILGQNEYTNLNSARDGANTELGTLVTGSLTFQETHPIATFIFLTNTGYVNSVKSKIVTNDLGENYTDWRTSQISPGVAPTEHGNLAGLTDDDHHQYALLAGRSGDSLIIDQLYGQTSSTSINLDKLTVDTTTTNYTILTSSDTNNILEISSSGYPALELHNTTHEDSDGGRESQINFRGEQSGEEITTLARIQASHDGALDDEKGDLIFYTNDGSDGDAPTERMRMESDGNIEIPGELHIGGETKPALGSLDAKLWLGGTDSSASAGPNLVMYGSANSYPYMHIFSYTHDDIHLLFDSYYDGAWKSSDAGSSFKIMKKSDTLSWQYDTSSAGGAITWNEGFKMDNTGVLFNIQGYGNVVNDRPLHILTGTGEIGTVSSLTAHKMNITDLADINWIYSLTPKIYQRKKKEYSITEKNKFLDEVRSSRLEYGFLAEDVQPINDTLIDYDFPDDQEKKKIYGLKMNYLIPALVKTIQNHKTQLDNLSSNHNVYDTGNILKDGSKEITLFPVQNSDKVRLELEITCFLIGQIYRISKKIWIICLAMSIIDNPASIYDVDTSSNTIQISNPTPDKGNITIEITNNTTGDIVYDIRGEHVKL
jgi:hypothetical protein